MRLSISVVGLVGVLAMPVPAVGADPPVLSVAYVGAHIGELHGKTVRLRGEVNNCESLTCSICDEGGRDAVCLPLDLWSDADFFKVGAVAAGLVLVLFVSLANDGGPPMDPRCTLPWC